MKDYRHRTGDVQPPSEETSAVPLLREVARNGASENRLPDRSSRGKQTTLQLQAHQQGRNARHDGGGETRPLIAWGEYPLRLVNRTPVAELLRLSIRGHRTNRKDGWGGGRDVEAVTPLVSRGGNDQGPIGVTTPDDIRE